MSQRGKRQTRQQLVGDQGEAIFEVWALDRQLQPQKAPRDLGVDYYCQHFVAIERGGRESTGPVLAVHVRSTDTVASARISLSRTDAEQLLRHKVAACVVGVLVPERRLFFRFVDDVFLRVLDGFLGSRRRTMTIRLDDMHSDVSMFDRTLTSLLTPVTQHRLRLLRAELAARREIPDVQVSVVQSTDGGFVKIKAGWIGSLVRFQGSAAATREAVFDVGTPPVPGHADVALKPALDHVLELGEQQILLEGIVEADSAIKVRANEEELSLAVKVRRCDDETAFVSQAGVRLTISDQKSVGGRISHQLSATIFRGSQMLDDADVVRFLSLLEPGGEISVTPDPLWIPVPDWGGGLQSVGPAIVALQRVCRSLGLPHEKFSLGDFLDDEFNCSVAFLNELMSRKPGANEVLPGIVVGRVRPDASLKSAQIHAQVPVVLNLKAQGLVVWFLARGEAFTTDGDVYCALTFTDVDGWAFELLDDRFDKSKYPEAWLVKQWPAIRILPGSAPSEEDVVKLPGDAPLQLEAMIVVSGPPQPCE